MDSAPPVRRRLQRPPPYRGDAGSSATPLSSRMLDDASAQTKPLAKAGSLFRAPSGVASLRTSRVEEESSFDGALYSLKAFSIATAFVVAGGSVSVWGVKTYLGVKDVSGKCVFFFFAPDVQYIGCSFGCPSIRLQTQEFASTMRLTILDKWPLLTSRIYRSALSDSTIQYPPHSRSHPPPDASSSRSASESLDGPRYPLVADDRLVGVEVEMDMDGEEWNWPAAQARLVAAYEGGGIAQFAETAVRELEAESQLERRKRRIGNSVEGQS